jgi:hypothetical protein
MNENPWQEIVGTPLPPEDAWRMFDEWRADRKEIGLLFCGRSGTTVISALCTVRATRSGVLQLKGETTGASLNLKQARFTYGPMQVFPRWPAPPPVEILALQAFLATGDWLVLAEGYVPKELSPLALPM